MMTRRLLHIDASVRGSASVSRKLTAHGAYRWRVANPNSTTTYRDLAAQPVPHLDGDNGMALTTPPAQHTPAQAQTYTRSRKLIDEIKAADTVILGMPLYNYSAPSLVKAWVDHIVCEGVSFASDGTSLLGETEFIVMESRGGGYSDGTPRQGWDHAEPWIAHGVSPTGLRPRIIVAELTMAAADDRMAHLRSLAKDSFERAIAEIDSLWASAAKARSELRS